MLIAIDTLRGDRLGAAGYADANTPALDSLATAGVMFRDANTPVPVTLPAMSSLLTGRYPNHHGVRDNERFVLPPAETTVAERFRDAGYRTAAVVASSVLSADRGLTQGFESYDDSMGGAYPVYTPSLAPLAEEFSRTRRRADTVTDLALEQLRGFGTQPFFLFVHYFDVHMYYDPPPAYAKLHPGRPYDGEVSFVDHEIGRLLAALRGRPDVLVVVVADHGESQNEHGEPQHGFLLYQATLHVPFLAAGPGIPPGTVRDDPVSLVDVEPTLARVFHLPGGGEPVDGIALDWAQPETDARPLYAETFHSLISRGWSQLRAVRVGSWKLIRGPETELYDLAADPHELSPVKDPARTAELGRVLDGMVQGEDAEAVYRKAMGREEPGRAEMLKSLGYIGGGGADTSAAPPVRPNPRDALPGWLNEQWSKELCRTAATLADSGLWDRALVLADSARGLDPDAPGPYAIRGRIRLHRGDPAGAAADARTALAGSPRDVAALSLLAAVAQTDGRKQEAFEAWTRVFEADETQVAALEFLSQWHLNRDDPGRALPFLRRLVSQEPTNPQALYNLALAAYRQNRLKEARRHFHTYLRVDPEAPQAGQVRDLLERLDTESNDESGF